MASTFGYRDALMPSIELFANGFLLLEHAAEYLSDCKSNKIKSIYFSVAGNNKHNMK